MYLTMCATVAAGAVARLRIAQPATEGSWGCGLTCISTSSSVSVANGGDGVSEYGDKIDSQGTSTH